MLISLIFLFCKEFLYFLISLFPYFLFSFLHLLPLFFLLAYSALAWSIVPVTGSPNDSFVKTIDTLSIYIFKCSNLDCWFCRQELWIFYLICKANNPILLLHNISCCFLSNFEFFGKFSNVLTFFCSRNQICFFWVKRTFFCAFLDLWNFSAIIIIEKIIWNFFKLRLSDIPG